MNCSFEIYIFGLKILAPKSLRKKMITKQRQLTEEDIRTVFDYINQRMNKHRNRAMLAMTIGASMRISELVRLRWSDVVKPSGEIKDSIVLQNGRRNIFFNQMILKELNRYIDSMEIPKDLGTAFFKTNRSVTGFFSPNSATQLISKIYRGAGIENITAKSGRYYFKQQLDKYGVSEITVTVAMNPLKSKYLLFKSPTKRSLVSGEKIRNAFSLIN